MVLITIGVRDKDHTAESLLQEHNSYGLLGLWVNGYIRLFNLCRDTHFINNETFLGRSMSWS